MAGHALSDAEHFRALMAHHQHGTRGAAHALGIPYNTFRSRLQIAQTKFPDWSPENVPAPNVETPTEEPLSIRQERRFRDQITQLQRELNAANRELNVQDDLRDKVFALGEAIEPKDFKLKLAPPIGSAMGEIPVLLTSDFQWGEVINLDEMGGLNAFNSKIASARYKRLIERTIDMCRNHHKGAPPPAFYYLRGGDSISGDIHEDLAETNDLSAIPAVIDLVAHEEWGIETIQRELGCPVVVISVVGNHDRTTKKPRTKNYVDLSFDRIISWGLERHFSSNPNVTFLTPREPDALFKVYETQFLLSHGNQVGASGGQGFVGPAATITRGMKKVVDYYASIGVNIDVVLFGHFHTFLELEYGWANGCLPGYSEFARGKMRARPKPPMQLLLHVHPVRGVVSSRKILVGGAGEGLLCEADGSPVKQA